LVKRLFAAQYYDDPETAALITADLQALHVSLGYRRTGTREEQSTYLLARSTRTPLPELMAVGIDTNTWPAPPVPEAAPAGDPEPPSASPDTVRRISRLFESVGRLSDRRRPPARYSAEFRPQDDQRHHGELLPWAICDTEIGLPISYHQEKDIAEYQADQASARYTERRGKGR
jgi:hypothetical protein